MVNIFFLVGHPRQAIFNREPKLAKLARLDPEFSVGCGPKGISR